MVYRASFDLSTESLRQVIGMVNHYCHIRILDDGINISELTYIKRMVGTFKNLQNFSITEEYKALPVEEQPRNLTIDIKRLTYFIRRVSGEYVQVNISQDIGEKEITFIDKQMEQRFIKVRTEANSSMIGEHNEKMMGRYRKLHQFTIDPDGYILTDYMKRTGNYILIEDETGYFDNKYPARKIQWDFRRAGGEVNLVETRKQSTTETMNDVFGYKVIKNPNDYPLPDSIKIYYSFENLISNLDKNGARTIALIYADNGSFVNMFLRNDLDLSTITTIRKGIASSFND